MPTQAELETAVAVNISTVAPVDGASLTAPAPVDMAAVAVENKLTANAVSAPAAVTHGSGVTTADDVSEESLNRNAIALAADVNTKMASIAGALDDLSNDLNSDASAQATEINNKLESLRSGLNAALEEVRLRNIAQNNDIAGAINTRMSTVAANEAALKAAIEAVDQKIVELDSVYNTDADFAARAASIDALIADMDASGLDVAALLTSTTTELDSLIRIQKKTVTVNSGNGTFSFNLASELGLTLNSEADYTASIQIVGQAKASGSISGKTAEGFEIGLMSQGMHYVPQPWAGDVTAVTVEVTVAHVATIQVSL
jgi:hypothetical protein